MHGSVSLSAGILLQRQYNFLHLDLTNYTKAVFVGLNSVFTNTHGILVLLVASSSVHTLVFTNIYYP